MTAARIIRVARVHVMELFRGGIAQEVTRLKQPVVKRYVGMDYELVLKIAMTGTKTMELDAIHLVWAKSLATRALLF